MFKNHLIKSILAPLVCLLFYVDSAEITAASKHVLYLNSYNLEMEWAAKLTEGIQEVFEPYPDYELHIEFLDTEEFKDSLFYAQIFELLRLKYQDKKPDLIICSDNGAMDFLLRYYNAPFFSELPVAFCGINNIDDYTFPDNFYGIDQNPLIENELNLIVEFFPEVETIYIVVDKSITGDIYRAKYELMEEALEGIYNIEYIDEIDLDSIPTVIKSLDKNGVINYLTVNVDKYGNLVKPSQFIPLISQNTELPIIGNPIGENREAFIGGLIQSGKNHGIQCAQIAINLLENRINEFTPKVFSPLVKFGFNYTALKKHGLKLSDLPKQAIIYGKEENLLVKYKYELVLLILTLFLLVLVVSLLSVNIVRRRKAEAKLDQHIGEIEEKNREINSINEELNESNDKLEKLNLTLSHTNIKLIDAKEEAEKASRLKSSFLFNISHEIRTPLNSIIGFSEMLLNENLADRDKQKYSGIVTENASRLLETIENVLEYSRIETGEEEVVLEKFGFVELVQDTIDKFSHELEDRGNSISCAFKKNQKLWDVTLDKSKCRRILKILFSTANKLNINQEFKLTCFPVSDFRFQLQLQMGEVEIESDELDVIFEPYAEKFVNYHDLLDGSGVGLTIAKGYIEMMNGTVFASLHQNDQFSISLMLPYE